MSGEAAAWLLLFAAGAAVFGVGLWLKRMQGRFVAGLRAAGDPLADHIGTKTFRQRFQAWLFGLGTEAEGPAPGRAALTAAGRAALTLAMVALLGLAAAWSLLPGLFG